MTNAPVAPGKLGQAPEPAEIQLYLHALDAWLRARRNELDELDEAAMAANRGGDVVSDMQLALATWKAVQDRYQLVFATWDGGRVLEAERQRISALIWGRLDAASDLPGGLAVSLPEACRLSDALTSQLRVKLSLVPGADLAAARIKDMRAQLERLRDQISLEPATSRQVAAGELAKLRTRLADITERAQRGGDVGGMLTPLENEATKFERDLIVGNATRRDARDKVLSARALRADLEAREQALTKLAEQVVATVDPAPRYAVPDVDALGPIPNTPDAIGPYRQRLDRVGLALTLAQNKYSEALQQYEDLLDLMDNYVAKARALGVQDKPDLKASEQQAREVLRRKPAPLEIGRQMVATYQMWLTKESG